MSVVSTQKETADFILEKLANARVFSVRPMFGSFALYARGKVVALICNDQLYVKILPTSGDLADVCDQDYPFPGAKLHYLVEEDQLSHLENLAYILMEMSDSLPMPKKKTKKKYPRPI